MDDHHATAAVLTGAVVAADVFDLRPHYRALLLVAEGITPAASDERDDALLRRAEVAATAQLPVGTWEDRPHMSAWREAYRAFGAKPQRTRNSLEALTRRAPEGLPRVNRLTDAYNAMSVLHQVPIGGEDLDRYVGSPRLLRATGSEPFDPVTDSQLKAAGEELAEHLRSMGPDVRVMDRRIAANTARRAPHPELS